MRGECRAGVTPHTVWYLQAGKQRGGDGGAAVASRSATEQTLSRSGRQGAPVIAHYAANMVMVIHHDEQ
jgi:hypothetical protein